MQGADIYIVARLPTHKDLRTSACHQQRSQAFLAVAMNRLDEVFGDLSRHSVTTPKALLAAISVGV
jgi:hypothetical protein